LILAIETLRRRSSEGGAGSGRRHALFRWRRRDLVVKVEGSAICSSWVQPHPIDAGIFFIDHRRAMGRLPFLASACPSDELKLFQYVLCSAAACGPSSDGLPRSGKNVENAGMVLPPFLLLPQLHKA